MRLQELANKILDDVVKACQPKCARVIGEFTPRGGLKSIITAEFGTWKNENR